MTRLAPTLCLALCLALGASLGAPTPAFAQPRDETEVPIPSAPEAYRSVHEAPPAWLAERFARIRAEVTRPGWDGPKTDAKLVGAFLHETYEHIREVNVLLESLGGRGRPLPTTPPSDGVLRGVHDFGERVSLARLEAFIAEAKQNPLKHFHTGEPVPVPEWLERLAARARAQGAKSVDVGKLSPYVAAGLSQPSIPDRYAIELHRLSPHHTEGAFKGNVLKETIADRINAMRQVRVYSKTPMPFARIQEILLKDVGKGLPADSKPLVLEALASQKLLEAQGRVNPYRLLEKPAAPGTKADPLARYRRANGTVRWAELGKQGAFKAGGSLAHFGLALFLKELALAVGTGDRSHVEEFFEAISQTDFYKHYGLFALGAAGGEVAYARYLERYVRPRFVNSILRTNVALATGLALPQLLDGTFEGKAFAITLGSLGLSASAVRTGVRGIAWVRELNRARTGTRLVAAGRLARAGGWFYTVAETAVVLLLAEEIEERLNAWSDEREARGALADANRALRQTLADPRAGSDAVQAAIDDHHAAWGAYRDYLYRPLLQDDAELAHELERLAREAKIAEDQRATRLEQARKHAAIRARIEARHGSLEAWAQGAAERDEGERKAAVDVLLQSYEASRREKLQRLYAQGRREGELLAGVEHQGWLLNGAVASGPGDPLGARTDVLARLSRGRIEASLDDALRDRAAPNRLQSYEDEAALLLATAKALEAEGKGALATSLRRSAERALQERALDAHALAGVIELGDEGGAVRALQESLRGRSSR